MPQRLAIPPSRREELVNDYTVIGLSLEDLSIKYQCGIGTIYRTLRLSGAPQRRPPPMVNEHFFDVMTTASAWVLGLWITDGWISETKGYGSIGIGFADQDLLIRVHNLMEATGTITSSPRRRQWVFTISNPSLVSALRARVPERRKVERVTVPVVPNDILPHMVRGILDGDGCFYGKKQQRKSGCPHVVPTTVFTYPSRPFLESLQSTIEAVIPIHGRIEAQSLHRCWNLVYGASATQVLGTWIYQDSKDLRYEAKHEKYLRLQSQTNLG